MAKLTAPLMSFNARGKLASSLVFMGWKGLKTVRQYVTPANPRSADQVIQRNIFTQAVLAWRSYFAGPSAPAAWDVAASVDPKPLSGFNLFMASGIALLRIGNDHAIDSNTFADVGKSVRTDVINIQDGVPSDEAGDFSLLVGTKPASLLPDAIATISAGELDFTVSGEFQAGQIVFVQIRKENINRSGIHKLTLVA